MGAPAVEGNIALKQGANGLLVCQDHLQEGITVPNDELD